MDRIKLVYSSNPMFLDSLKDILEKPILDGRHTIIYAVDNQNNEIIGAIILSIVPVYNDTPRLIQLNYPIRFSPIRNVNPNFGIDQICKIEYIASRRKGIGSMLLFEAEKWFRSKLDKPIVQVISLNSAVGFYRTMGFEIMPNESGNRLGDRLKENLLTYMQKKLT